ncbi:uncharacterized protein WM277_019555 isoform 3-T3 [Molossus nigricans]
MILDLISHCSVDQDLLGLEDPIGLLGFSTAEPPWNAAATQLLDRGVNRILPLVLGESFNSIFLLLFRVRRVRIFYHLEFLCLADLSPNLPVYGRQYTVTTELQKYLSLRTQEDLFARAEVVSHTCRLGNENSFAPLHPVGRFPRQPFMQ